MTIPPHVIKALHSRDDLNARLKAVTALAELGTNEALAHLIGAVDSRDRAILPHIMQTLDALRDPRATAALVAFTDDENPMVRRVAYESITDPQLAHFMLDAVLTHRATAGAQASFISICRANPSAVRDEVARVLDLYLYTDDSGVRSRVGEILAGVRPQEVAPDLHIMARDTEEEAQIRARALRVLAYMRDQEATGLMLELLQGEDGRIARAAASGLKILRKREDIPALIDLLSHETWQVRQRALSVLASRGIKTAIPEAARLLEDGRARVRAEAIRLLARTRAVAYIPALTEMAESDRSKKVRAAAGSAVKRLQHYAARDSR